jgi:hypothetical protein
MTKERVVPSQIKKAATEPPFMFRHPAVTASSRNRLLAGGGHGHLAIGALLLR